MMQRLGRSYVALFNARHGRTGTLWEGRYKSCLVDSTNYVLTCYRYIELNPIRARMVGSPDQFPWSSYASNAFGQSDPLLTPHPCYLDLGSTTRERADAYRAIVSDALTQSTIDEIRSYLQQQRALGHDAFRSMVETKTRRFATVRPAHRPRNQSPGGSK
jgi:putative transposase